MRRLPRLIVLAAGLACALVAAGCGNKIETRTQGQTEGLYLDVDELKYQIQESRYINANDVEDRTYLEGLPQGTQQPAADETWFGIWMRVSNSTDKPIAPANDFEIVDTQNDVYRPVPLDTNINPFAYKPDPIPPNGLIPTPDSVAFNGPIQGSLILFKIKTAALQNRPLELRFRRGGTGTTGRVDLDV
jgi:hypothetical protein